MRPQIIPLLAAFAVACGNDDPSASSTDHAQDFGATITVPDGHVRYYSTLQEIAPGESVLLVEWVAPPFDTDMDILDLKGGQTEGGHHASLSASAEAGEVGSVRPYSNEDQLTSTFLGAVGEMSAGSGLPSNYAFRVRKGEGLFLQTHYVNVTSMPIRVRSYVDVKMTEASDDHQIISLFANTTISNHLPPKQSATQAVDCVTQGDLSLVMFTNHMHEWGVSTRSVAMLPDGTMRMLKNDPVWNTEWTLNANYTFAFDEPVVLPKGTTVRTTCTWENTTDRMIAFPDEMCTFASHYLGKNTIACTDGVWSEIKGETADAEAGSSAPTRVGDGACSGDGDLKAVTAVHEACTGLPKKDVVGCALPLLQGDAQCVVDCYTTGGASEECGGCFGDYMGCNAKACSSACTADPNGEACTSCTKTHCCAAFEACSGLSCP